MVSLHTLSLGLVSLSLLAFAQSNDVREPGAPQFVQVAQSAPKQCPNNRGLEGICNLVGTLIRDRSSSSGRLAYQSRILAASCVEEEDSAEVIKTKVRQFWNEYGQDLTCKTMGFVDQGNLIKFAVFKRNTTFIDDATFRWGIDLNKIDASDGKTALDYTEDEMGRFRGTPIYYTLNTYYKTLRAAGAKHSRELGR